MFGYNLKVILDSVEDHSKHGLCKVDLFLLPVDVVPQAKYRVALRGSYFL